MGAFIRIFAVGYSICSLARLEELLGVLRRRDVSWTWVFGFDFAADGGWAPFSFVGRMFFIPY
jgi:hypothetical protein